MQTYNMTGDMNTRVVATTTVAGMVGPLDGGKKASRFREKRLADRRAYKSSIVDARNSVEGTGLLGSRLSLEFARVLIRYDIHVCPKVSL